MLKVNGDVDLAFVNVAGKLGFSFWKPATVDDGYLVNLYRLRIGVASTS